MEFLESYSIHTSVETDWSRTAQGTVSAAVVPQNDLDAADGGNAKMEGREAATVWGPLLRASWSLCDFA